MFGQIKECRDFCRFSMRGLEKCDCEWSFVCASHNLLKLFRYGVAAKLTQARACVETANTTQFRACTGLTLRPPLSILCDLNVQFVLCPAKKNQSLFLDMWGRCLV